MDGSGVAGPMPRVGPPDDFLWRAGDPRSEPDWGLIEGVRYALWFAAHTDAMAIPEGWPEGLFPMKLIERGADAYLILRRAILRMPALSDRGRAAKAALALHDLNGPGIREANDLGGMAMLALAEDLIARIM